MNRRTQGALGGSSAGSYRHAPTVASLKTLSRLTGAFYFLGGIAAVMPTGEIAVTETRQLGIDVMGYLEVVAGLALLVAGHRWPRWAYHLFVAGGTCLIASAIMLANGSGSAEDPLIVFALPIIAGAAFFSWRGAAAHTVVVLVAAFVAMSYVDVPANRITMFLGGLACIGGTVAWLARLADRVEEDPLLGLGNRRAMERQLEAAVEHAARTDERLALVMLDLDHFKSVNDGSGHAAGDELLVACAHHWRTIAPDERLLFRYGGDEFALLLPGSSLGGATEVAERMRSGLPLGATASVGVATWEPGDSGSLLMGRADVALYDAKANGRDRTAVYGDPSHAAREVEVALLMGEFVLHYQPVVDLADGGTAGKEALVRWQHPQRGLLGPCQFIPQAERTGAIHALGAWTLDRACADTAAGPPDTVISINVSIVELRHPPYASLVQETLEDHNLAPRRLVLEVTEGVYDEHDEQVATTLAELRRMGVHIALDDFGSGWSSLRWLTTFPVDALKIDGSFIHAIDDGDKNLEVLSAVIKLGKALRLKVVGEHVETERQAQVLRELGCDYAQGYYFGRPDAVQRPTVTSDA